jgi:hypothetical protein
MFYGRWIGAQAEKFEDQGIDRTWETNSFFPSSSSSASNIGAKIQEQFEEYDTFRIYKSNSNEVFEINFLISCYPLLSNFLEDVRKFKVLIFLGKL